MSPTLHPGLSIPHEPPLASTLFTMSTTVLRERFLPSDIFYPTPLPVFIKTSLGAGSSTAKAAGLHAVPSPTVCLNHTTINKRVQQRVLFLINYLC